LVLLLGLMYSLTYAQGTHVVKGKVFDKKDGSTLPGVSILVKGTTNGTVTDMDGNFSLSLPDPNAVLQFSFIGYQTEEVRLNGRTSLEMQLAEDVSTLSEVVVVGYGTQERRDLTGSVAKVRSEDIENVPIVSADALLQGRAAGVVVTNNSGAPGSGVSVVIRGLSSLNASNEPLYVVDGVPITSQQFGGSLAQGGSVSPIADINPNDIASLEILKDAAATSIYGARASNGVVLITTKRGREGPPRISLNMYTGITQAPPKLPLLNGDEMKTLFLEAAANDDANWANNWRQLLNDPTHPDYHLYKWNTDWQELVRQTGTMQDINLSVTGGDQKLTYALSPGYTKQGGTIVGSGFERFTTNLNVDYKATARLTLGNSLRVSRSRTDRIDEGNNFGSNPYFTAMIKAPYLNPWRIDMDRTSPNFGQEVIGAYAFSDYQSRSNPLQIADQLKNYSFTNRAIGNLYLSYDLMPGLNFRTNVGIDFMGMKESRFAPQGLSGIGRQAFEQWTQNMTWINENILSYSKVFNNVHNFSALVGYTQQRDKFERVAGSTDGMIDNIIETLNAGPNFRNIGSRVDESGIASYLSRVTYIYNDKYSVNVNIRRDGSSRFGENNRWANFPSVSAYWRLSNENFMQGIGALSDFKIRASWGYSGNQGIPVNAALSTYGVVNYSGFAGIAQTNLPSPSLSWETTEQINIGADISFFRDRLTLIADYFVNNTSDLLVRVPVPVNSGFSTMWGNVGDIRNQGVELNVVGRILTGSKVNWTVDWNISRATNTITRLNNNEDIIVNRDGFTGIARVGESLGTFYGWIAEGVYARDADNVNELRNANGYLYRGGDVIFRDINGDGIIDEQDRVAIGSALPDFFGGITNTLSYKGFDLNVLFQYEVGKDVMNATRQRLSVGGSDNVLTSSLRRWRQQGDETDIPIARRRENTQYGDNNRQSTRWLEDGSYLRLKSVMLGYNIPSAVFRDKISRARVYVAGNNLLTFTRYLGQDPEFAQPDNPVLNGIDFFNYPQSRVYTMGVNFTF
jgi:TonB-dependent starch-binding outer membrane protein SusC